MQRQDPATLELLCDCGEEKCKNLHVNSAAASGKKMRSNHLGYLPLPHEVAPPAPLPSASTIVFTASTGCHVVHVSGYSRTKQLFESGKCISSAEFAEAGHTWQIQCYPNGQDKESDRHVSLFLRLTDESTNVRVKFELSLVPHDGKLKEMPQEDGKSGLHTFLNKSRLYGFGDFMKIEALENSEYFRDDSFSIRCDITVLNAPSVVPLDLEALHVLCHCKDDLCTNLHAVDKEAAKKVPNKSSSRVLKKLFLGCLPSGVQSSEQHCKHE